VRKNASLLALKKPALSPLEASRDKRMRKPMSRSKATQARCDIANALWKSCGASGYALSALDRSGDWAPDKSGGQTRLAGDEAKPVQSVRSTRDMQYNEEEGTVRMYLRGRPVVLYVPTLMMESYDLHKVSTPPQSKLKLDWVYGYRGRDCRSNLHLLPTGEIVYFVAAVVVLYNMEEHSQRHYLGHTDDVKW